MRITAIQFCLSIMELRSWNLRFALSALTLLLAPTSLAQMTALPGPPTDPRHGGSKVYSHSAQTATFKCSGRDVDVVYPTPRQAHEIFPVVIYGHGQALGFANYRGTLEHLARKGIVAIHPMYDRGFFDQDWARMGRDYVSVSACALDELKKLGVQHDSRAIVFSGHSKGAFVASMAAGLSHREGLSLKPDAILLFQTAGVDSNVVKDFPPQARLTLVFSDRDQTVKRQLTDDTYRFAPSMQKQILVVRSYPSLEADHFWPLTQGSFVGGGNESALHYFSAWKWLVSAAEDLQASPQRPQGPGRHPLLYGADAIDKGVAGLQDEIAERNF
ncbi:MAG TPA: hypothetical protein PLZ57_10700 [Pseudobdellovibrionaceae bacterium]|nr:hypothetical protein [Pseudobdellovibrionaceae bacterium]